MICPAESNHIKNNYVQSTFHRQSEPVESFEVFVAGNDSTEESSVQMLLNTNSVKYANEGSKKYRS